MFNCIVLSLVVFLNLTGFGAKPEEPSAYPYGAGVFSWDHLPNDADVRCLIENDITEIYQYIRPEYTQESIDHFLRKMAEYDIDVYILDGEPEWSYEKNYSRMKDVLDRVREWNENFDRRTRIKGIVFDVEPYVLDKWHNIPNQLLEEYTGNVSRLVEEASKDEKPVDILLCIPYSYDNMGRDRFLRSLIKDADGIIVMNYYKGAEIENIKREAALARWYKKKIVNAYELQPGLLSQTNNSITYYKDGLDAVNANYQELINVYNHHDMGVAFHTLEYLRVLTMEKRDGKDK